MRMAKQQRMSASEYRKSRFRNENEFEAWVISILRVNGWRISSMKDSRKQRWDVHKGIPDIVAIKAETGELLFAELKMPGKKPTPEQEEWIKDLRTVFPITVVVWRPENEQHIIEFAGGKQPIG